MSVPIELSQKIGALVTEILPATIYHSHNITDGAELILFAATHRAERPVICRAEGGMVGQSEIVADFMQGYLQCPLDETARIRRQC